MDEDPRPPEEFPFEPEPDAFHQARREMVERQLRRRGIRDERVLEVMARIPRERFLPRRDRYAAYEDRAVPIAGGQTLSQPFMVAAMTEALRLGPTDRVLEIGTGSGYQTAVLARLAEEVFTVELLEELSRVAEERIRAVGSTNVHFRVGDGSLGWPEEAPFDAILVTAAAPAIPATLYDQLSSEGGRMVVPVGTRHDQDLIRLVRTGNEAEQEALLGCRFVPLLGAEGWR